MLQNKSLKTKLITIILLSLFITLVVGGVGLYSMNRISSANQNALFAEDFHGQMVEMQMAHLKWRLSLGVFQRDDKMKTINITKDPKLCAFGKWYYSEERKNIEKRLPRLSLPLDKIEKVHNEFHESAHIIENFLQEEKRPEALSFFSIEVPKRLDAAIGLFEEMKHIGEEYSKEYSGNAEQTEQVSRYIILLSIAIGAIVLVFIGYWIAKKISSDLLKISQVLGESSDQVKASSQQLAESAQSLSETTNDQASSIEETSATLEEIQGMIVNNLKNAEHAKNLSEIVKNIAEKGSYSMNELDKAIKLILDSNSQIEGLTKIIGEIADKTQVIDEIVFQTKLLSFNASVEAERAGEQGRGFSVVAQEVGNLAQMSGKAASEISSIVKKSLKSASEVTSENKLRVEKGNELVKSSSLLLNETNEKAESVVESVKQVLTASQEQAHGIKQIGVAMERLNRAIQANASSAEEAASSSEELTAQTESMNHMVNELNKVVSGA